MRQPIVSGLRSVSIFKRLLFAFLLVIIAPIAIVGTVTYSVSSQELEQNIGRFANQYMTNLNDSMMQQLKQYDEISYKIYLDEGMVTLLKRAKTLSKQFYQKVGSREEYEQVKVQINSRLYHWTDRLPYAFNGIEIVTPTDDFTQIDGVDLKGSRLADRTAFLKSPMYAKVLADMDEPFWYVSRVNHSYFQYQGKTSSLNSTMSHLRAIRDPADGDLLGLIIVHVPLLNMVELYKGEQTIGKGNLLLVGNDGKAELSFNEKYQGPYLSDALGEELAALKQGVLSRKLDGRDTLITFQTSPYTGWTVVSLIPEESLYAGVYHIRDLIIRIGIIFAGLAIIVSYLVTVSISGPLVRLKRSMEQVISGELNVRYDDPVNDEIGLLGRIFNRMIGRIRELIDTIYQVEADKQNEMVKRKEAELNELQMQMNPHFLYNTLDIIRWQAMFQEHGEGKVSQMIGSFSNLMKMSLIRTNRLVTIEEEAEHLKAYWKVLDYHYNGSLALELDIAADVMDGCICKFALQPIIENAVVHGTKGRKEAMTIRIQAFRSNDDVRIVVSDNGVGMEAGKVKALNESFREAREDGKHIGIQNVNERIRLRFGNAYGLHIHSSEAEGTIVEIRIPYVTER